MDTAHNGQPGASEQGVHSARASGLMKRWLVLVIGVLCVSVFIGLVLLWRGQNLGGRATERHGQEEILSCIRSHGGTVRHGSFLRSVASHFPDSEQVSRIEFCIDFTEVQLSDATFADLCEDLAALGPIEILLGGTAVGDRAARRAARLKNLRGLSLAHTSITSRGLAPLVQCRELYWLDLASTSVDDRALPALIAMRPLRVLCLDATKVSPDGIEQLRHRRPEMYIEP